MEGPPIGIVGLTGEGISIWAQPYGGFMLDHQTGRITLATIGNGSGSRMWLSDNTVLYYAGRRVGGLHLCEDGTLCDASTLVGVEGDLLYSLPLALTYPAWSPLTREVVAQAGTDLLYAGCTDGQAHWMLQLPTIRALNAGLYVRESGEIVLVADTSYVFSPDGEVLRQNTIDALSLGLYNTSAATFVEGCGALLVGNDRWAWLDAETLTLGPPIVIPGGYPASRRSLPPRTAASPRS